MIRDITGVAFGKVSDVITIGIDAMPVIPNPVQGEPDPDENPLQQAGITGEDILGLGFCGLNMLNAELSDPSSPVGAGMTEPYDGPLLGPKFTLNGLDFTGTVAGMLMLPPSPLGLIYLLIMLLQNIDLPSGDPEEGEVASQENMADPNVGSNDTC